MRFLAKVSQPAHSAALFRIFDSVFPGGGRLSGKENVSFPVDLLHSVLTKKSAYSPDAGLCVRTNPVFHRSQSYALVMAHFYPALQSFLTGKDILM